MPTERINEATRREWRELGFFYDHDTTSKVWRLIGSQSGLSQFVTLLREYISDPRRASLSEHDHYGPYMYLKVMTWNEAGIDEKSIHGSIADLTRLAHLVDARVTAAREGDVVLIKEEFSPECDWSLRLEFRGQGFDPASEDPDLNKAS